MRHLEWCDETWVAVLQTRARLSGTETLPTEINLGNQWLGILGASLVYDLNKMQTCYHLRSSTKKHESNNNLSTQKTCAGSKKAYKQFYMPEYQIGLQYCTYFYHLPIFTKILRSCTILLSARILLIVGWCNSATEGPRQSKGLHSCSSGLESVFAPQHLAVLYERWLSSFIRI